MLPGVSSPLLAVHNLKQDDRRNVDLISGGRDRRTRKKTESSEDGITFAGKP